MSAMEPVPNSEEIDFQKYWLILQRRWLPAVGVCGVVVTLASLLAFSSKPTFKAEGSLLIKTNRTSSLTGLGEAIGRLDTLTMESNPSETQAKIVASVPVIQETIAELNLRDDKGKAITIEELTNSLKISSLKGTEILQVSYIDKDPKLAARVVNKVMQAYIKNNIEANRQEAVSARKFIQKQLPTTEVSVKQAESALRQFKENNKIITLQEEASAAVQAIAKLNEQISQAQAQLEDVTARSQKLQAQAKIDSSQTLTNSSLTQASGIQQVLTQLQEAQSQLAVERTRLKPEHPIIVNLEEKVAALNSVLQQRMKQVTGSNQQISLGNLQNGSLREKLLEDYAGTEAQRVGLVKQIATLSNQRTVYKERANILPKLEQTQRELERKLKAAQTTYETLLTRLQEVQVAENQNIGNARVISPALVPDKSIGSGKILIIGAGGILGVLFGAVAAFALDTIDPSLKTVKQAKELFKYTLLGVIPLTGRNQKKSLRVPEVDQSIPKVIGRDIPHFPVGDAYQMLQANLKFLSSDREPRVIVVTSSVSGEGKSEVAANLAMAMTQVGHRVLLVDADMRHPVQHHIWNLTNAVGLSHVIVNPDTLNVALQEAMPNLDVIPSGVVPPNPVALLDSKCMAALVSSFTEEYDFVIFDTPPLGGVADAAVLGNLVDGILWVVRPGVVDFSSANAAKDFLKQSGHNVLGMVINGVNVKSEPDSYFYYTKEAVDSSRSVSRHSVVVRRN
ncbi:lipopolysaccharide biosynthesis protein [Brasilonema bromeliae SPC951]|uniref:non-specific protein-tyrosine kinase n=2 Tax=Bromeliae group (in: Brasilonema) TaxID=3398495 RepID=A0ABX1P580_9CYAN|nr:lipopolysaccharide biosynthesis protein [Brasilonema bromeliae SPC951]